MKTMIAPSPKRITTNGSNLLLSLLFLLAVVLACSSGSAKKCTATLTLDGLTFVGEDAAEEKATRNACNKYCREADPGYEAMYGVWLDSPAGKAAGRPSKEITDEDKVIEAYKIVVKPGDVVIVPVDKVFQ